MTALTPQQKELQRFARSRAGQIRHGMRNYIETLGVIAVAFQEQDHLTLGYDTWDEYLAEEFDHQRLQLDPAMRDKAITELRLGGLSQRAIASTLGVGRQTVADHEAQVALPRPPEDRRGVDGKTYSPARSPLVEAITGAIEDAAERAENLAVEYPCEGAEYGVCGGEPHTDDCPASDHRASPPGEADGQPSAAGAGLGGPVPAPNSPSEVQRPGEPTGEPTEDAGSSAVTGEPAPDPSRSELSGEEAGASAANNDAPAPDPETCRTCGQPLPQ